MIDPAQRRLGAALIASVMLHGWLAHTGQGLQLQQRAQHNSAASRVPITVLFREPAIDYLLPDFDASATRPLVRTDVETNAVQPVISTPLWTMAVPPPQERPVARSITDAADGNASLAQTRDPTYYSALSLDVYPRATTTLDLGALLAERYATGQVRATVLIDESGLVNEVRAIEAIAPDIEQLAREMLLHARFTPARKDGRIVKAQLRVSLDYGAR
jgi:hypothetical protein